MLREIMFDANDGAGGNAANPGSAPSSGNEESKAYTQADLDRLFAERARQASSGEQKRILAELGVKDLDEAKALAKKQREADQAQLTELDKVRKQLTELETEKQQLLQERKAQATRSEIEREALKLGIVDPEAAYKLLDPEALEFDDSGKPKNVEKALRALLTNKPYLAASTAHTSAANPAGGASKNIASDPIISAARKAAGLPG